MRLLLFISISLVLFNTGFIHAQKTQPKPEWGNLGGGPCHKFPITLAYGPDQLAVFWDAGDNIFCRRWQDNTWSAWEPIPWPHGDGNERGRFKVISWGPGRMDAFTTLEGHLYHTYWDGKKWSAWDHRGGGDLEGEIELLSWAPNRLDIFAITEGGGLKHTWWDNGWGTWEELREGKLPIDDGFVRVTSWGPGRLDIFAQVSQRMEHLYYDNGWGKWENLGGLTEGRFTAVCSDVNRINLFAPGMDGKIWGLHFYPTGWSQWYELQIPVKLGSALQAISRKKGEVDLFYTALNGSLGYRQTTSEGAINLQNLGGFMLGGLSVASWGPERLDVIVLGGDRQFYHLPWDGQKWGY
jgi:hypothetical protein